MKSCISVHLRTTGKEYPSSLCVGDGGGLLPVGAGPKQTFPSGQHPTTPLVPITQLVLQKHLLNRIESWSQKKTYEGWQQLPSNEILFRWWNSKCGESDEPMQHWNFTGQQNMNSHKSNPDWQKNCRGTKRPRIIASVRKELFLIDGWSGWKPLTNNRGRVHAKKISSVNRSIVNVGHWQLTAVWHRRQML